MPFQPINFASIAPLGNPAMRDLIPTIIQGLQAGAMPAQLRRAAQTQQLANAMSQLKLQQEPQDFAANMKSKDLANAFQGMLNQEQPDKFSSAMASAVAQRRLENANTNRANTLLPYDVKRGDLATNPAAKVNYVNALINSLQSGPSTTSSPTAAMPPMRPSNDLTLNPDSITKLVNNGVATNAPPGTAQNSWDQMRRTFLGLPVQTPAEKAAQQLNTFKAEQDYKNTNAMDNYQKKQDYKQGLPTSRTLSSNQAAIESIQNVIPELQKLQTMQIPGQLFGKIFSPTAQASYKSQLALNKDTLQKGLLLNPSDKILETMDEIAGLQPREDSAKYKEKLQNVINELIKRLDPALKIVDPKGNSSYYTDARKILSSANLPKQNIGNDPLGWR